MNLPSQWKLIVESDFHDFNVLTEQVNPSAPKKLYIEGVYAVAETKNGNGRVYKNDVMLEACNDFQSMIKERRSLGELNHSNVFNVDPANACHLIESLKQSGNTWIGKSVVLEGTPKGDLLAGLLKHGVKIGISSRGVGVLSEAKEVTKFKIATWDIVHDPSGPGCFVNGILESKNFIVNQYGEVAEMVFQNIEKKLTTLPHRSEERVKLFNEAMKQFMIEYKKVK